MNYFNFHINDFNFATRHLSLIERAIYRDLLDMYYDTEKPIDASNFERLARRVQCNTDELKTALTYVLEEFFTLKDELYINNRCEREIAEYRGKRKQASEAGKISAKKRAEKKQQNTNNGASNTNQSSNENSTSVEDTLKENPTDVQLTNNHKPVTSNQEPETNIIDSSSNVASKNFPLPAIQFSQYQSEDHKRYALLECVGIYPLQHDFIDLAINRFSDIRTQDLIDMFTNFGDFFVSKGDEAKNTPSLWLVKWFTWVQNNKDDVSRKRKENKSSEKPQKNSNAGSRTSNEVSAWIDEIACVADEVAIRDVHEVEGAKYA